MSCQFFLGKLRYISVALLLFVSNGAYGVTTSASNNGGIWGWLTGADIDRRLGVYSWIKPTPPTGNYTLSYEHNFHASGPWTGSTLIPKPDPEDWEDTSYRYPGYQWDNTWGPVPPGQPTTITNNGHNVKSTDGCICWDESQWSRIIYNMAPRTMGGALVLYAHSQTVWATSSAAYVSGVRTWATCKTLVKDPYHMEKPVSEDHWGVGGRVALGGEFTVGPLQEDDAEITLAYSMSRNGGAHELLFEIVLPKDPNGVSLTYASDVTFWRDEMEILPADIVTELQALYGGEGEWQSPMDFGEMLSDEFFLDVMVSLPSTVQYLDVYSALSTQVTEAIPEPATISLLVFGGAGLLIRRRRK